MLALPFGYMSDEDHVHCFHFGGKLFLTLDGRLIGLIIVLAWRSLPLVLGIRLDGLFKNPTISIGVVIRLVGGAMNMTGPLEDFVQIGWTIPVAFKRFLPLTGFRTTESGIDCHVICVVVIALTFVFIEVWFTIAVPGVRSAGPQSCCFYEPTNYLHPHRNGS